MRSHFRLQYCHNCQPVLLRGREKIASHNSYTVRKHLTCRSGDRVIRGVYEHQLWFEMLNLFLRTEGKAENDDLIANTDLVCRGPVGADRSAAFRSTNSVSE